MSISIANDNFFSTVEFPAAISFSTRLTAPLFVCIETERLKMSSVSKTDIEDYAALHGDPVVMEKFATGETKDIQHIQNRIGIWTSRWDNHDPFSGLCIRNKKTNEFIGHIILGYTRESGKAELVIVLKKECWNQRYGTEAISAILESYAPELIRRGYLLRENPLKEIIATSRVDLIAGNKILQRFMGNPVKQEKKYGALRNFYSLKFLPESSEGSSSVVSKILNIFKSFVRTS